MMVADSSERVALVAALLGGAADLVELLDEQLLALDSDLLHGRLGPAEVAFELLQPLDRIERAARLLRSAVDVARGEPVDPREAGDALLEGLAGLLDYAADARRGLLDPAPDLGAIAEGVERLARRLG